MNVSATGAGTPVLQSLVRLSLPGGPLPLPLAGTSQDSIGGLLELLASPGLRDLLTTIDTQRFNQDVAIRDTLLRAVISAVARKDIPLALEALTEYINHNPEHAAALTESAPLAPIKEQVVQLLRHLTQEAKTDAERQIATATLAVSAARNPSPQIDGLGVLTIAERFVESGQLINYFRAAELSQAVMAFYPAAVVPLRKSVGEEKSAIVSQRRYAEAVRTLWRRVPMLVLLGAWLAAGLAVGIPLVLSRVADVELITPASARVLFESWGLGFLLLILFQFFFSLRNAGRKTPTDQR
jgi:hypothetical protein